MGRGWCRRAAGQRRQPWQRRGGKKRRAVDRVRVWEAAGGDDERAARMAMRQGQRRCWVMVMALPHRPTLLCPTAVRRTAAALSSLPSCLAHLGRCLRCFKGQVMTRPLRTTSSAARKPL